MLKFRMYSVSLMAVNQGNDLRPDGEGKGFIYWAHRGAVCLAGDIEDAGRQGEAHVHRLFPKEDGFSMHNVVVTPIETEFFETFQDAVDRGFFTHEADPDERTREFNFDPGADPVDLSKLKGFAN